MADPLSITASILAVIQTSNAVIHICYKYADAVRDHPSKLSEVVFELKQLRTVLEKFADITTDPGNSSKLPTLEKLLSTSYDSTDTSILDQCGSIVQRLRDKLGAEDDEKVNTKAKAMWKRYTWSLKEEEVEKMLQSLQRLSSIMNTALHQDQIVLTLDTHRSISQFRNDFHRSELLNWLGAPDPSTNYNIALRKRIAPNTGSWFTKNDSRFSTWLDNAGSFLWLHGIPGSGKTILSSTIISEIGEHLLDTPKQLSAIGYFYFVFDDNSKRSVEGMIRSLLSQFIGYLAKIPTELEKLFANCNSSRYQPPYLKLETSLYSTLSEFSHAYIVIDALDECREKDLLVDFIQELIKRYNRNVHVLVTSRKENPFKRAFIGSSCEIVSVEGEGVKKDIEVYVRHRLENDKELKKWRRPRIKHVQSEIFETLIADSQGMFHLTASQLDQIANCISVRKLRDTLKTLPRTLYSMYERILCNIEEDDSNDVKRILCWLTCYPHPIQLRQLAEVIAINTDGPPYFDEEMRPLQPRDILDLCPGLITTYSSPTHAELDRSKEYVKLMHLSFRDYLFSDSITQAHSSAARYHLDENIAQNSVAEMRMAYLLQVSDTAPPSRNFVRSIVFHLPSDLLLMPEKSQKLDALAFCLYSNLELYFRWLCEPYSYALSKCLCKEDRYLSESIFWASRLNFHETVTKLSMIGGKSSKRSEKILFTALLGACENESGEMMQRLISLGAPVTSNDPRILPLHIAASSGNVETTKILLNAGADPAARIIIENYGLLNVLHCVTGGLSKFLGPRIECIPEIIEILLKDGRIHIDEQDESGRTALFIAARIASNNEVLTLLHYHANPNIANKYKETALHQACFYKDSSTVKILIDNGADVNARTILGEQPLDYAVKSENLWSDETVDLLLQSGAEINNQNRWGNTALDEAAWNNTEEVVTLLLMHGAKGQHALEDAVRHDNGRIVRLFLEHGFRNEEALACALVTRNTNATLLLLKYGLDIKKALKIISQREAYDTKAWPRGFPLRY